MGQPYSTVLISPPIIRLSSLSRSFSHSLTGSVPEAVLKNLAGRIFSESFIHRLYHIWYNLSSSMLHMNVTIELSWLLGHPFSENVKFFGRMSQVARTGGLACCTSCNDLLFPSPLLLKRFKCRCSRERVETIAKELHCDPQTVRRLLHRFETEGIEGLGDRLKPGRPRRLTAADDSQIIALVSQAPAGRLVTQEDGTMVARDEQGSAQWSLTALAQAAKEAGIPVKRSQIRIILRREGVRWRQTHSWGTPREKDFVSKERWSSPTTASHRRGRRPSAPTNSGR
jgi:transposase